ncbi:MAG: acyltransferase [Flavobacteriales bacterium]
MSTEGSRVFGLDAMRALAITLVVLVHSDYMLWEHWPGFPWLPFVDGVDLFFVLSGYLVGGILFRYATTGAPSPRRLLDFWQRRWLRTLPNYYLFLIINIVLLSFGLTRGMLNYSALYYFAFLQNLFKPVETFFWESWSLVIEEWFYLLFPVLLFGLMRFFDVRARRAFVITAVLFILGPTIMRFITAPGIDRLFDAEMFIRKLAIYRLDTIGFGVLAAWVHHVFPALWARMRWPAFAIGAVGTIAVGQFYGSAHLWFSMTWFFTLGAISMSLLLPQLSAWKSVPRWGAPVVFMSRISYALYLVHMPVRDLYDHLYPDRSLPVAVALFLGYWAIVITIAAVVHRWWETPFMDLRDRLGARLGVKTVSSSS